MMIPMMTRKTASVVENSLPGKPCFKHFTYVYFLFPWTFEVSMIFIPISQMKKQRSCFFMCKEGMFLCTGEHPGAERKGNALQM